jgi:PHD/YefM family antitoxin component YafN of YafNO toxin-antitoxin module
MAEYNLSEFRKNTRKAFDEAERGEPVYIERYGEDFILISKKNWNDTVNTKEVPFIAIGNGEPIPKNLPPAIKKIISDSQANEMPGVDSL